MVKTKKGRKAKEKSGKGKKNPRASVPPEIIPDADAPALTTKFGSFDLEDPRLPDWVGERAFRSGGYPHHTPMKDAEYEELLVPLQIELIKLQHHVNKTGRRMVSLFEGRDAAGKGGVVFAVRQFMNPRTARVVALTRPTETERGQWYFQRYITELPTRGEIVLFDRSWYNRAGVEPVMGFCTESECREFVIQAPEFESMLVSDGIVLLKFWLDIGQEMQLKRFHERRHDSLKIWKLSSIDYAALERWDAYTEARDRMLAATDRPKTPWTVVLANDKRRARLAVIRKILSSVDYRGRDDDVVGTTDAAILGGAQLLNG